VTSFETRIWLVRHAPTAWTGRRYCGRADPPLSEEGRRVADAVAVTLAGEVPRGTPIWASPARRARATAEAIAAAVTGAMETADELVEVNVGRVEGLTWGELSTREPDLAAAIGRGGPVDWPDGESAADLTARAAHVAARIRAATGAGTGLVVVSHGTLLHAVSAQLAGPGEAVPAALEAGGVLRLPGLVAA
jgi:broad specificity phosphatase PhoE